MYMQRPKLLNLIFYACILFYYTRFTLKRVRLHFLGIQILKPLHSIFSSFFCRDKLQEVVQLLRNTSNPQVEFISRNMKKWARENQVNMHP